MASLLHFNEVFDDSFLLRLRNIDNYFVGRADFFIIICNYVRIICGIIYQKVRSF